MCTQRQLRNLREEQDYPFSGVTLIKQSQIPARASIAQDSDKLAHKPSSPTVTARCPVLGLNTPKVDRDDSEGNKVLDESHLQGQHIFPNVFT